MAMKGDEKSLSFVEDTAVQPEVLRDYIDEFLAMIRRNGSSSGVYAHASVGCLHVRPVVNMKTAEGVARFEAIATQSADLVLKYGGALSGEHGDGLVRGPFMEKMFGPALYQAFRTVKHTFDPHGVFNPGKIVDSPAADEPTSATAPATARPIPPTYFDYSEYGGFGRAVEMCSGVGACRKKLEGTMCPSYMATRDERDTTRGRANTLRLAMSGRLAEAGLGDEGVLEALELCLECRACKAECPVGVDVARFKSEFLAEHWRKHGIPLGKRVLGNVRALSKIGSQFAPLVEQRRRERRRPLDEREAVRHRSPAYAAGLGERDVRATGSRSPNDGAGAGCGGRWCSSTTRSPTTTSRRSVSPPSRVLDAAGVDVRLEPHVCCGRPLISTGQLDQARALAQSNADALFDAASRGERILFLEPSCLSAVREDAPALLRGEEQRRAQVVGEACMLFEDYLEREWAAGRLSLAAEERARPASCCTGTVIRSRWASCRRPRRCCRAFPSCTVVDLDSGCCGMAGSFGYAKDHYEVSRQIGERRLLPAARALKPGEVLAAAGTSCRHQVAHFAGVEARASGGPSAVV